MKDAVLNSVALADVAYVGFWQRFFAAGIDLVLLVPAYILFKVGINLLAGHDAGDATLDYMSMESMPNGALQWAFEAVFDAMALLLYAWFFSSKWQGSPGMYLLRYHVCDKEGKRISFMRALMWGITALFGVAFCFAGILYMQKDIAIFRDMSASCQEQNIAITDCIPEIENEIGISFSAFQQLIFSATAITFFLCLIWALSIALPKDKTGFHNLICGTRFVKGRPVNA